MTHDEIVRALRNCKAYKAKSDLQTTMLMAADLIESLQAELAELRNDYDIADAANTALHGALEYYRRREQAAVEDLTEAGVCFTCKHFQGNGGDCFGAGKCRLDGIKMFPCNEPGVYRAEVPDDGRDTYDWRGPQDAEKGAAE